MKTGRWSDCAKIELRLRRLEELHQRTMDEAAALMSEISRERHSLYAELKGQIVGVWVAEAVDMRGRKYRVDHKRKTLEPL